MRIEKTKIFIKENLIFFITVFIFVALGFRYVNLSARNIVFMDFWRNVCKLIEPIIEGEWPWDEFWLSQGGQRNFLQMFLIAFNIKYTNLNCIWESYAGIVVIALTSVVVWFNWAHQFNLSHPDKRITWTNRLMAIPVLLCLFNFNQWEILSLQFSFAFMLRIFCYVLVMTLTNNLLQKKKENIYLYLLLGLFIALVIDLMSQLYWPALVITLFITWLVDGLNKGKTNIKAVVAYWLPIIASVFLYLHNLGNSGTSGIEAFINLVKTGEFFLAILYMLAGLVMPQSLLLIMESSQIYIIGIFFVVIIISAIIIYFKNKLYTSTYFPMMLCAYGLVSIPIIIYGRVGRFDLMYVTASRYTCETALILLGLVLTYNLYIIKSGRIFGLLLVMVISAFICLCNFTEFCAAPYRGAYKDNLFDIMQNIELYEDEDLSGFQANNPQLVRTGVELMKKYKLNVFEEKNLEETGCNFETDFSEGDNWDNTFVDSDTSSLKIKEERERHRAFYL